MSTATVKLFCIELPLDVHGQAAFDALPLENYLAAHEFNRLQQFQDANLRRHWLLARALREAAFRSYWQIQLAALCINDNGKPALLDYPQRHFNISHHPQLIAIAVADTPLGLDVESRARQLKKPDSLLKKHFADSEARLIRASREPVQQLLAHWCVKEAYLKARGAKIAGGKLDQLPLAVASLEAMVQAVSLPFAPDCSAQLWRVDDSWLALVAQAKYQQVAITRWQVADIIAALT